MAERTLRHREDRINGVRIHWVEAGEGPLVVLLHGFPEFWYSWRHQIRSLADDGFRVVVPDQRGYNRSGKPREVSDYRLGHLVDDVIALVDRVGGGAIRLAGHDWGGVVAWALAYRQPGLVRRLAVLNAPHPAVYRRLLYRSDQLLRSWYALFFRIPRLPERWLRRDGYAVLSRMLRGDPVREGAFDAEDVAAYERALEWPGALTAALNWYRANLTLRELLGLGETPPPVEPPIPVLVLWGMRDRYLSPRTPDGLDALGDEVRVVRLEDASHWVQADAPDRVSHELARFFSGRDDGPARPEV